MASQADGLPKGESKLVAQLYNGGRGNVETKQTGNIKFDVGD